MKLSWTTKRELRRQLKATEDARLMLKTRLSNTRVDEFESILQEHKDEAAANRDSARAALNRLYALEQHMSWLYGHISEYEDVGSLLVAMNQRGVEALLGSGEAWAALDRLVRTEYKFRDVR